VADLAARDLPPGVTLQDLGTRRLRDLKEPERLLQVVHPDVPADFPPLKALDESGLVIYLNSFSKVGFPGLRVGWIVASPPVIARLRWAKQKADLHTNLLGQAVVQEMGRRGWLDHWIRKTAKAYAHKQDVLRSAIERHFPPQAQVNYAEGGMSVWVELPVALDAAELLVKARERHVVFAPSRYFYFQNPKHNALRLCYTALADDKIEKGVGILGELLKSELRRTKKGSLHAPAAASVALV
jgi:2-aminoadipate transaminase